jgi:salicylate hydroxylase
MAPTRPILIAGGGIGGLALGLALAQRNVPSHIVERRETASQAGAGIQIGPNGQRVLAMLDIAEPVGRSAGVPSYLAVHEGRSGDVLTRLPLGDWISGRHGAPYWVVHRADLQAALLAAATAEPRITLTRGFDVASVTSDGTGVRLNSARGSSVEGAALVGADGIFSAVRRDVVPGCNPTFAGRTAARAVIAIADLQDSDEVRSAIGVWLAPDAHVVHYPIRGGRELAVVVIRRGAWQGESWSAPAERQVVIDAVAAQFSPRLATLLGRAPEWTRWALFEQMPLPRWTHGRVTLLGDAAHPTLPFLAQGGSLALEDAVTLAALIAEHPDAPEQAFSVYEQQRRKRTSDIVAAARRNGQIYHLGGLAAAARNLALRVLPPKRLMARYDWIYGWTPPVLPEASTSISAP